MRHLKNILTTVILVLITAAAAHAQYLTHPIAGKQKKPIDEPPVLTAPVVNIDSIKRAQQAEQLRIADSIAKAKEEAEKRKRRRLALLALADTGNESFTFPLDSAYYNYSDTLESDKDTTEKAYTGPPGIESADRVKSQKIWVFIIAVVFLLLLMFSRLHNPKNFYSFIRAVFNWRLYKQIVTDTKQLYVGYNIRYFLIYTIVLSLLISVGFDMLGVDVLGNDYRLYLLVFLVVTVISVLKYLVHLLLGDMLEMETFGFSNIQYSIIYNLVQAIVILPVVLITYYNTDVISASVDLPVFYMVLFFALLVIRVLINIILNRSYFPFSIFYLFIYLCVLEILPIFVGIKAVLNII